MYWRENFYRTNNTNYIYYGQQTLFTLPAVERICAESETEAGFDFTTLLMAGKCSSTTSGVCSAIFSRTSSVAWAVDVSPSRSSTSGSNVSIACKFKENR